MRARRPSRTFQAPAPPLLTPCDRVRHLLGLDNPRDPCATEDPTAHPWEPQLSHASRTPRASASIPGGQRLQRHGPWFGGLLPSASGRAVPSGFRSSLRRSHPTGPHGAGAGSGLGASLMPSARAAPAPAPRHTLPRDDHASRSDPAEGGCAGPILIPLPGPHPPGRTLGEDGSAHKPAHTVPPRTQKTLCAPKAGARRLGLRWIMRAMAGEIVRREARSHVSGQNDASGGESAGTGMEGAPSPPAGRSGVARGAPIPYAVDPGKAEQTRPMASRSFVQWRAPPGRHEPRPLYGVWVDGVRDRSWGTVEGEGH
ncbi:hypothetical protein FBY22_3491 [Streptomyces sp. SLBN-31]|nr:hypothetical protein FBY22_3491 [Streptomyces sp. SLBN-31]